MTACKVLERAISVKPLEMTPSTSSIANDAEYVVDRE
jgi:hypothetical protein